MHLLPAQGPIGVFVHHNTLHAFQRQPFTEAVEEAARVHQARPYLSLERFQAEYRAGRVTDADLEAELAIALERAGGDATLAPGLSRHRLWALLLRWPLEPLSGAALAWRLEEGDRRRRLRPDLPPGVRRHLVAETRRWLEPQLRDLPGLGLALTGVDDPAEADRRLRDALGLALQTDELERALWSDPEGLTALALDTACQSAVAATQPRTRPSEASPRPRDRLLALTGEDADDLVHPFLIRWVSAFLDQGQAYWPLPDRERGLFDALLELWTQPGALAEPWQRGLGADLRAVAGKDPAQVACDVLEELGTPRARWEDLVTRTLLALPGWSGMVRVLEQHPELAPSRPPQATVVELLALRLLLDRRAGAWLAKRQLGVDALRDVPTPRPPPSPSTSARAWLLREVAELAGLSARDLRAWPPETDARIMAELDAFDDVVRRRVWHLAYERHHREQVLGALHAQRLAAPQPWRGSIQAAFCIDEREESLRRALEELGPQFETFGAAGFYGLAIDYKGLDDAHHAPLCPVGVTPSHAIHERPLEEDAPHHAVRRQRRRLAGLLARASVVGSQQAVIGAFTTLGLGLLTAFPLLLRTLFPRLAARLRVRLAESTLPRPRTQLTAIREHEPAGSEGSKPVGFTVPEAIERVGRLLEDMGLTVGFARLIAVLGHGSRSLNNPHESAHDCGACSGRHGAANARLFAALANHPAVREGLREQRGIEIPAESWFVGGFHDTCTSGVDWFDLEQIPDTHRDLLDQLRSGMERARQLSAHERCRRFEAAPLELTPAQALRHVEARAEHLAEPRPEYGHATNAICVVGRRAWTRGLFLDRRAFLVSYDPSLDPDTEILTRLLSAVGPVGAGINLEYYFSYVDNERYGCGTKLPHNITGLLGVMNGHQSDLRTGLPWQMVEIHEPVRLLTVVEATPAALHEVARRSPGVAELVGGGWIQLVSMDPETGALHVFRDGDFQPCDPPPRSLPEAPTSADWYAGQREHLAPARILAALEHIA